MLLRSAGPRATARQAMKAWVLAAAMAAAAGATWPALAQQATTSTTPYGKDAPKVQACESTGLIALQQSDPGVKKVVLDPDSVSINAADTSIGDTKVRTIIFADAYVQANRKDKPRRLLCIIGDKGKVLLTFFAKE
jgi:hypothetical protein